MDDDRGQDGLIGQVKGTVEQLTQMSMAKAMQTMQAVSEQVQGPMRQIQEWVSGGSLQAVTDDLRDLAGRLRQEIERQVQALDRTRKELEQRITGQIEALGREQHRAVERVQVAPAREPSASTAARKRSTAKPATAAKESTAAKKSTAKTSTASRKSPARKPTAKKSTAKRSTTSS